MKKVLFSILLISLSFFSYVVYADTEIKYEDAEKVLKEVMRAYYARGERVQYNHPKVHWDGESLENATSQDPIYLVCSGYIYNSYRNAFGMKIPQITSTLTSAAKNYYNNRPETLSEDFLIFYQDRDDNSIKYLYNHENDITWKNLLKEIRVGDVLVVNAHALIVYELMEDDALLLNLTGKAYERMSGSRIQSSNDHLFYDISKSNITNLIEGGVHARYLSETALKDVNCDKGCSIIRPIHMDTNGNAKFNYEIDYNQYNNSLLRTIYPNIYVEKTVSEGDKNSIYINSELTYTITIKNNSNILGSSVKYNKKLYIQEVLGDNVQYVSSTNNGKYENNIINWTLDFSSNNLKAGDSIEIKYTVKVKNNTSLINKSIVSEGKISDTSDFNGHVLSTGLVENKIIKSPTAPNKAYNECYNSKKDEYSGLALINEIYKCSKGKDYGFDKFNFSDVIYTIENGATECAKDDTDCNEITNNTNNIISLKDSKYKAMILNNYWNALVKYKVVTGTETKDSYILPRFTNGNMNRADTINSRDFKDGDILIYYVDKKSPLGKEEGMYAYIFINGEFKGINTGYYRDSNNDWHEVSRNIFTPDYYKENDYIKLYKTSGSVSAAILNVDDDRKEETLKYVHYQSLFSKDYYVILRPEEEYTINYYLGNGSSETLLKRETCNIGQKLVLTKYKSFNKEFPNNNNKWSFAGWSNSNNKYTIDYNDGDIIYCNNLDLYAVGSRTLNFYSGENPTDIKSSTVQYWNPYSLDETNVSTVSIPKSTSISGWEFIGYRAVNTASSNVTFDASTQGNKEYVLSPSDITVLNFRSIYKRNATLSYNSNGGKGTMDNQTLTQYYNSGMGDGATISEISFTLDTNNFTKDNGQFAGWIINNDTYKEKAVYKIKPAIKETANIVAYAKWSAGVIFNLPNLIINDDKRLFKNINVLTKVKELYDTTINNEQVNIYKDDILIEKTDNETILSTGQTIKYYDEENNLVTYKISVNGDPSGDGNISSMDYIKIKNHIMQVENKMISGDEYLNAADYNKDNKISSLDYVSIKNYIMNRNDNN